jgi:maltose O-acetyltransferase
VSLGYLRSVALGAASARAMPRTVRWAIHRACGLDIRTRAVASGCSFFSPGVSIARGTYVNVGCLFDASAPITIGAGCSFGPQVSLITSTHAVGPAHQRAGDLTARPITIGAGTWIGARATVLPGVTIAPGCIIAAGAVVADDCAANGIYAGVPAKRIRVLD